MLFQNSPSEERTLVKGALATNDNISVGLYPNTDYAKQCDESSCTFYPFGVCLPRSSASGGFFFSSDFDKESSRLIQKHYGSMFDCEVGLNERFILTTNKASLIHGPKEKIFSQEENKMIVKMKVSDDDDYVTPVRSEAKGALALMDGDYEFGKTGKNSIKFGYFDESMLEKGSSFARICQTFLDSSVPNQGQAIDWNDIQGCQFHQLNVCIMGFDPLDGRMSYAQFWSLDSEGKELRWRRFPVFASDNAKSFPCSRSSIESDSWKINEWHKSDVSNRHANITIIHGAKLISDLEILMIVSGILLLVAFLLTFILNASRKKRKQAANQQQSTSHTVMITKLRQVNGLE